MFVKICGVTTAEDALLSAGLGADAIGVNFVGTSARRITENIAKEIVRRLPPEIITVGIFRNHRREQIVATANKVGLRAVQLHGDESPDDTLWVAERIPNVIRAFSSADFALGRLAEFGIGSGPGVQLLIDSPEAGSGRAFDWTELAAQPPPVPYLLAGGLTPENLGEAIAMLQPWGVDVASGVERTPREKDPAKLQRFIALARSVAPSERERSQEGQPISGSPLSWEEEGSA